MIRIEPKAIATFALRLLARVAFAVWFGGFTFYAAVVVPDLHESLGGMETGDISRRVAPFLYMLGLAALLLNGLVLIADRAERSGWRGKARLGLLAASALLLVVLVAMHWEMGARLDSGTGHDRFFSLHETYLTVFAVQWLANLGLLALDSVSRNSRKDV